MFSTKRCQYDVFDPITKRNRKCKKGFAFLINGCKCCHIHANKDYGVIISKIQAIVRGNLCRNKTNKLKTMPYDIQHIITGYVREEFENSRYNCQLSNFLVKKIYNTVKKLNGGYNYYWKYQIYNSLQDTNMFNDIIYVIKMIIKYKSILEYNKKYNCPDYNLSGFGLKDVSLKYAILEICKLMSCHYDYYLIN